MIIAIFVILSMPAAFHADEARTNPPPNPAMSKETYVFIIINSLLSSCNEYCAPAPFFQAIST